MRDALSNRVASAWARPCVFPLQVLLQQPRDFALSHNRKGMIIKVIMTKPQSE